MHTSTNVPKVSDPPGGVWSKRRYATAMNSCGSCIFTALWAIGVQPGDKVRGAASHNDVELFMEYPFLHVCLTLLHELHELRCSDLACVLWLKRQKRLRRVNHPTRERRSRSTRSCVRSAMCTSTHPRDGRKWQAVD